MVIYPKARDGLQPGVGGVPWVYPLQKLDSSLEPLLSSYRRASKGQAQGACVGVGGKALAWAVRMQGFQSHPDPEQFIVSVGLSFLSSGRLTPPIDSPHLIFGSSPESQMLSHPGVGARAHALGPYRS